MFLWNRMIYVISKEKIFSKSENFRAQDEKTILTTKTKEKRRNSKKSGPMTSLRDSFTYDRGKESEI